MKIIQSFIVDLVTNEGARLVKGEWRYSATKIVEIGFKIAGADGQQPERRTCCPATSRRVNVQI